MKLTLFKYRVRRATWYVRNGLFQAVTEFFRRRKLRRLGTNISQSNKHRYPKWVLPRPLDPLSTQVAIVAPEAVTKSFAYEWNQQAITTANWRSTIGRSFDLLLVTSSAASLPIWEDLPAILRGFADRGIPRVLWLDDPSVEVSSSVLGQFSAVESFPPAIQPMIHNPQQVTVKGKTLPKRGQIPLKATGSLAYEEALTAYRLHESFLLPSEDDLPALRRIALEIQSCGSTIAVEPQVDFDEMTAAWQAHVVYQNALLTSTYEQRAREVIAASKTSSLQDRKVGVTPLIATVRPKQLPQVLDYLARQKGVEVQPIVCTHGFEASGAIKQSAKDLGLAVNWVSLAENTKLGQIYNRLLERADHPIVAKMDDDDFYDSTYLLDAAWNLRHSGADIVGKRATFVYLESLNEMYFCFVEDENRFVHEVAGPTIVCTAEVARATGFSNVSKGEDSDFLRRATKSGASIYAGSRFGFVRVRSSQHTWDVNTSVFTANGELVHSGEPTGLELPGKFGEVG